jgi:hypothetical protein
MRVGRGRKKAVANFTIMQGTLILVFVGGFVMIFMLVLWATGHLPLEFD